MAGHVKKLLNWARSGAAVVPGAGRIPVERTDLDPSRVAPFTAGNHYLTVRVNELFLCRQRQWFVTSMPMVFAQTELTYGTGSISVPFVVGPALVGKSAQELPQGMLFQNTRVAGVYPYVGDRLSLTLVLHRVVRQNHAQQLLGLLNSLGAAFDVSTALAPYLRIAGVIEDGLETLLGLDGGPELGLHKEFDTNAGDDFGPGYFVLLGEELAASDKLWVRNHRLLAGPDEDHLVPVRDRDYALYSITQTPRRDDIESLPWFASLWRRIVMQAGRGSKDGLDAAIADLQTLGQEIYLSPDLSKPQKRELIEQKRAEMYELHDAVVAVTHRSGAGELESELDVLSGIVRSMGEHP